MPDTPPAVQTPEEQARPGKPDGRLLDIEARLRDDIPAMKDWRTLYFEDCQYLMSAIRSAEERGAAREREDAERKGVQLCNAVGTMMLACKRLRSLQEEHTRRADANKRASHGRLYKGGMRCQCETCSITLPDLSDEAVESLAAQSNAQARVLDAAERFIAESGSGEVGGRVRWVGDCYIGGELAGAVFHMRSLAPTDGPPETAERGKG